MMNLLRNSNMYTEDKLKDVFPSDSIMQVQTTNNAYAPAPGEEVSLVTVSLTPLQNYLALLFVAQGDDSQGVVHVGLDKIEAIVFEDSEVADIE